MDKIIFCGMILYHLPKIFFIPFKIPFFYFESLNKNFLNDMDFCLKMIWTTLWDMEWSP